MIIKYNEFINESWESDLLSKTEDLISSDISKEEIEDYFLEFIDDKFSIKIDLKIMYSGKMMADGEIHDDVYDNATKKSNIISHKCFPIYEISLRKSISYDGDTNPLEVQKKLKIYDKYIDMYRIACDRIVSLHIVENIYDRVNFENNSIQFIFRIKINKRIPKNFVEVSNKVISKDPYIMLLAKISSNAIFSIESQKAGKYLIIDVRDDRRYNIILKDPDYYLNILERVVGSHGKVVKLDNYRYEVIMT